jgi:hypothetical protein
LGDLRALDVVPHGAAPSPGRISRGSVLNHQQKGDDVVRGGGALESKAARRGRDQSFLIDKLRPSPDLFSLIDVPVASLLVFASSKE